MIIFIYNNFNIGNQKIIEVIIHQLISKSTLLLYINNIEN